MSVQTATDLQFLVSFTAFARLTDRIRRFSPNKIQYPELSAVLSRCTRVKTRGSMTTASITRTNCLIDEGNIGPDGLCRFTPTPVMRLMPTNGQHLLSCRELMAEDEAPGGLLELIAFAESNELSPRTCVVALLEATATQQRFWCVESNEDRTWTLDRINCLGQSNVRAQDIYILACPIAQ